MEEKKKKGRPRGTANKWKSLRLPEPFASMSAAEIRALLAGNYNPPAVVQDVKQVDDKPERGNYSEIELQLIQVMVDNYRKSGNKMSFVTRLRGLR
jgi:hypothetical protein